MYPPDLRFELYEFEESLEDRALRVVATRLLKIVFDCAFQGTTGVFANPVSLEAPDERRATSARCLEVVRMDFAHSYLPYLTHRAALAVQGELVRGLPAGLEPATSGCRPAPQGKPVSRRSLPLSYGKPLSSSIAAHGRRKGIQGIAPRGWEMKKGERWQ